MVTRSQILGMLPPYQDKWRLLEQDQSTQDIVDWILKCHQLFKSDYDRISEQFLGKDCRQTVQNVFRFLKQNVPYYIEGTEDQTVRPPASIVAVPIDCKNYALFINGVLDSLRRKGLLNCQLAYRFANYNWWNGKEAKHVFAVVNPGTKNELWVDPVLESFDQRKNPHYYKDKLIKPMALYMVSGVDNQSRMSLNQSMNIITDYRDDLENERYNKIAQGRMKMLSPADQKYAAAINKLNTILGQASIGDGTALDPQAIVTLGEQIFSLFGGKKADSDPSAQSDAWNKLDAKRGHQPGSSAADTIKNVRADIPVSAVVRWIAQNGIQPILSNTMYGTITKQDIIDFFTKKGQPLAQAQLVAMGLAPAGTTIVPVNPATGKPDYTIPIIGGIAVLAAVIIVSSGKKKGRR